MKKTSVKNSVLEVRSWKLEVRKNGELFMGQWV
jgi:hypothetical protein